MEKALQKLRVKVLKVIRDLEGPEAPVGGLEDPVRGPAGSLDGGPEGL